MQATYQMHLKCKDDSNYRTVDAEQKEQEKSQASIRRKVTPKENDLETALEKETTYPTSSKQWGDIRSIAWSDAKV